MTILTAAQRRFLAPAGALLASLLLFQPSAATAEEGWSFGVTPYGWLTSIDGTVSPAGAQSNVPMSKSFTEIVSDLEFTYMMAGEARNDRIGLLFDFLYVNLSSSTPTPFGVLWSEAEVETKSILGSAAVAYRVYRSRPGWIDLYAGVRVIYISTDVTLEPGLEPRQESSLDKTLVDPIIGARAHLDIVDGFSVTTAFDVGGFGVGTDLTWQVLGTLDYAVNDWITLRTGYRHMSIDYSNGGNELDLNLTGPIIGASFRF